MREISILAVVLTLIVTGAAVADNYEPRGSWRYNLVIESETGEVRQLLLSSASYPATCVSGLPEDAKKTERSNGYVWTDPDGNLVSWSKSDIATVRHEVVGFSCSFERKQR